MNDPQRIPAIRVLMMPRDTNAHGTIFGGVILSHIDQAGAVAAPALVLLLTWTTLRRSVKNSRSGGGFRARRPN